LKEAGIDASSVTWLGVLAPAKTPPAVVDKLNKAINEVLADPKVKASYEKLGYEVRPVTQTEFASRFATDFPQIGQAISKAGIEAQ
jgi:tripartite-type tricarboxylate transporter receptor subunit TctC